ncbi:MAG: SGNH/GDSL hydrolase family protein [Nitriliruptorales bacterium]|nr:SGNH/GDSL hydrolase family protein [Nitriliruptorales bacterium]
MRTNVLLTVVIAAVVASLTPGAAVAAPSAPARMAAIGDSITRATDVCCWYGDHPGNSWTTGGASWDGVRSHYERLRTLNPKLAGNNHNVARAGAKMSDAPSQAARAVERKAQYVTVLMGANDVCTSSIDSMTSVAAFRSQFASTMDTLRAGIPRAHVFVASIPNVYHLWQLYDGHATAEWVWSTARICQSLLSNSRTEAQRQQVLTRVRALNEVLAQVCAEYRRCRFDGNAVFNYSFNRSHVSKLDYFHPSLGGQAVLADATWHLTPWGGQ